MKHKYSWLYGMLILLLGGWVLYADMQPKRLQLAAVKSEATQLAADLADVKLFVKQNPYLVRTKGNLSLQMQSQPSLLADMFALMQATGLQLLSVTTLAPRRWQGKEMVFAHLVAQGDFTQFATWVFYLAQQSPQTLLTDFTYQLLHDRRYLLKMDVVVRENTLASSAPPMDMAMLAALHDPFCFSDTHPATNTESDAQQLQAYSVQAIKMVGYLQEGERKEAMVALPNGKVIGVTEGMQVGVEKDTVVQLARKQMVLHTNKKQPMVMAM